MTPYFSIILPVYNVAAYLRRCIQSVLEQDFHDYELILVDDGSTDESGTICDRLEELHPCIRVIHKANGGLSSARNAGLEIARGEYIWWVDSDDWIAENALNILFEASAAEKPDMVKFNYVRTEGAERPFISNAQPGLYEKDDKKALLDIALLTPSRFCLSAWSYLYRRDFLAKRELSFVSERVIGSEDYLFNLQALVVAEKVRVIPEQLYFYELRNGSLSQSYRKNLPDRYTQLYTRLREFYSGIGLLEQYEHKICRFFVWHLIHGTCISNEYQLTSGHSIKEGRRKVQLILNMTEVHDAIKKCDCTGLNWKQRLQLFAMRWRLECVFYQLYVKK